MPGVVVAQVLGDLLDSIIGGDVEPKRSRMMMGGMGMGGGMSPMKPAPTGPAETKPQ